MSYLSSGVDLGLELGTSSGFVGTLPWLKNKFKMKIQFFKNTFKCILNFLNTLVMHIYHYLYNTGRVTYVLLT